MRKKEFKSTIIERVRCLNVEGDPVTSFKWLARMNCYIEGSMRGYLKFRDVEKKGECFLQLTAGFSERVQSMFYNQEKNILFSGSREGNFKIWKIPNEWR